MKKITIIILLLTFSLSSCYRYGIRMHNGAGVSGLNGQVTEKKTKVITLWGAKKDIYISENCPSGGIYEVEVKTTFLQSLVNIVTLGFCTSITIEYKCAQSNE